MCRKSSFIQTPAQAGEIICRAYQPRLRLFVYSGVKRPSLGERKLFVSEKLITARAVSALRNIDK
jgi:hypothetical protein